MLLQAKEPFKNWKRINELLYGLKQRLRRLSDIQLVVLTFPSNV